MQLQAQIQSNPAWVCSPLPFEADAVDQRKPDFIMRLLQVLTLLQPPTKSYFSI